MPPRVEGQGQSKIKPGRVIFYPQAGHGVVEPLARIHHDLSNLDGKFEVSVG